MNTILRKAKIETILVVLVATALVGCSQTYRTIAKSKSVATVSGVEVPKIKAFDDYYRSLLDGLAISSAVREMKDTWTNESGRAGVPQTPDEQLNGANFATMVNVAGVACRYKVRNLPMATMPLGSDSRGIFKNVDVSKADIAEFNKLIDAAAAVYWSGTRVASEDRSMILATISDVLAAGGGPANQNARIQAYIGLCVTMITSIHAIGLN